MQTMKNRTAVSDDMISWIVAGLALAAVIVLNSYGLPQKWHAAVMWTGVAFAPPTIVRRKRWGSWSFWAKWTICLSLHLLFMWFVFALLLARLRVLGMLYVVPFGAVESFVLLAVFSKRRPALQHNDAGGANRS